MEPDIDLLRPLDAAQRERVLLTCREMFAVASAGRQDLPIDPAPAITEAQWADLLLPTRRAFAALALWHLGQTTAAFPAIR